VSLGPGDRDEPSAPITILGIPSANPAVIELFRNFLRVIVFIGLIDWLRADATRATEIPHAETLGPQAERFRAAIERIRDGGRVRINGYVQRLAIFGKG